MKIDEKMVWALAFVAELQELRRRDDGNSLADDVEAAGEFADAVLRELGEDP